MTADRGFTLPGHSRAGFSLLEVLVACGILMLALASIAAILPAAATRLSEATAYDRAAATMEMAFSEIRCRSVASPDLFPTGTWAASTPYAPRTIAIGDVMTLAASTAATGSSYMIGTPPLPITAASGSVRLTSSGTIFATNLQVGGTAILSTSNTIALNARINNDDLLTDRRGYLLEDDLTYRPPTAGTLPENAFTGGTPITSGTGPRQFNRGLCWGALIKPEPWGPPSTAMSALDVSVAVFRKAGQVKAITLFSGTSGPAARDGMFLTSGTSPMMLQRVFLKPCSAVLALPPATSGTAEPQWLRIRSSWILTGTMRGQSGSVNGVNVPGTYVGVSSGNIAGGLLSSGTSHSCVMFAKPVPMTLLSGTPASMTVLGFEHLLDVQERTMTVE